jgi:hypothetical protein
MVLLYILKYVVIRKTHQKVNLLKKRVFKVHLGAL